ncbi:TonB-dependent receptor plug domain-containing protein [Noviherbaspirillum sp. ST9]|uniref:TonB-dependent receptor plug domain-containing protein n=1 Tax=Noviherbaspirillum sp. ST9 TaxID=3401606 RepID=UPI003B5876A1
MTFLGATLSTGMHSSNAAPPVEELVNLSLEELANIQITSVSKKGESLADAAASVFVITQDDIRRSGATSLPEALRLAPNLHVGQISAHNYAISARGFNNISANKLLVMIDGRSVYTPLFSGVFWDVQDVMLEDVDRIEVISGPGGTLWGTNAVNGIINVITQSARTTQGGLASIGAGNRESGAALRHGGKVEADGSYRVYGKYTDRKNTETANGTAINDAFHQGQAGFRMDWERPGENFTLQGNAYDGKEAQPEPGTVPIAGVPFRLGDISLSGINLRTRWERLLNSGATLSVQAYFDRTERRVPPTFSEKLDVVDLQLQHSLPRYGIHAPVWGAEYRYGMDRVTNSPFFAFLPARVNQTWSSVFAQDEMRLRDNLRLTVGARVERNEYTGNEFLPNIRLAWKPAPEHLLWSALSRTVRAPSRLDRDAFVPGGAPFVLAGGRNVRSEIADVIELGYRGQPIRNLSYSVTAYHADYEHLRTLESNPSGTSFFFSNLLDGTTKGIEMWGNYQATKRWRLSGGWTLHREKLKLRAGSTDVFSPVTAGNDPSHMLVLRSSHDLSEKSELDVTVRRVGALSAPAVPAYTAVGFRYGWRFRPGLELSVVGQNLNGGGHGEFTDVSTRSELERSIFFKIQSRF